MTFSALLTDFYSRMRYPASPVATIIARVKRHHNEAHREILALPGLSQLRDDVLAISATLNVPRTALPQAVARVRGITDRTNFSVLPEVTLGEIRLVNPAQTNTSNPQRFAVVGWQPVALQPANASELFIKSTSASDGVGTTAFLEGIRSNGSLVSLSIAMNGTTAKTFGAAETGIVEVTKFYLSAAAVGDVTLLEDSGAGTELAKIPIGRAFARYLAVEWDPIPGATATLYADVTRHIPDLVNDGDEPLLPDDFHFLVGLRARMKEYEVTNDLVRLNQMRPEWDRGTAALRSWVLNDGARVASLRPIVSGWSALGPTYPAGS